MAGNKHVTVLFRISGTIKNKINVGVRWAVSNYFTGLKQFLFSRA